MNAEELQRIFDSVPEEEPRSRLEPYRELILRWRRQGRSYRRIRQLLAEQCSVGVTTSMLHKFVKSRSRPRKAEPEFQSEPVTIVPLSDEKSLLPSNLDLPPGVRQTVKTQNSANGELTRPAFLDRR